MPFWPNWRESMDYVRWRPPPRTSPLLRVDASPWQWRLCGRVKAWTRQQDGWPLPAERTCGPAREMAALFSLYPEAVSGAADLGRECAFDLKLIAPKLPPFDVPAGHTEAFVVA